MEKRQNRQSRKTILAFRVEEVKGDARLTGIGPD
jgi:hypothetical protein